MKKELIAIMMAALTVGAVAAETTAPAPNAGNEKSIVAKHECKGGKCAKMQDAKHECKDGKCKDGACKGGKCAKMQDAKHECKGGKCAGKQVVKYECKGGTCKDRICAERKSMKHECKKCVKKENTAPAETK